MHSYSIFSIATEIFYHCVDCVGDRNCKHNVFHLECHSLGVTMFVTSV